MSGNWLVKAVLSSSFFLLSTVFDVVIFVAIS